ncbi:cytochrome [Bordetella ansorpii]|uniref:Cytochrome n=1 Tax=Bordetella ansorpii TaxID=288768 RepID=A0A157PJ10_9BORD|nr:cytochrome c [Bordetella ansorpii]SAI33386.1 cytochrome [Bordetella ansorpii]
MKLRLPLVRLAPLFVLVATCAIAAPAKAQAAAPAAPAAAGAPATAPITGNVQNARDKVSMCIGCHGIPGYKASFPELYHVPMIAGQNARYIEAALNEYKKGARSHPTMDAIAGSLSDQDIADLAAYYSNLK